MIDLVHEIHVERMLGRHVRDANGERLGRLEELRVEIVDGEPVVTEFHVGPAAFLERIADFVRMLPFFGRLPFGNWFYRIPWQQMDLTDPRRPATRVPRASLERATSGSAG